MIARLARWILSVDRIIQIIVLAAVLGPLVFGVKLVLFSELSQPTTGAVLSTIETTVEVQGLDTVGFNEAQENQVLVPGDNVRTSQSGQGLINFADSSSLVLEPGSEIVILPPKREGGGLVNRFSQTFGSSWAQFSSLAQGGGSYEIQTPAGVVSVRDGASLRVGVGKSSEGKSVVKIVVVEGSVAVVSPAAPGTSVVIAAGETITAEEGKPLPEPEAFVPDNFVAINLHSPFWLLVMQPGSRLGTGLAIPGVEVIQIPLSNTTPDGISPQRITLAEPRPGDYIVYLLPQGGEGEFTVDALGTAEGQTVVQGGISGHADKCEWLYLILHLEVDKVRNLTGGSLSGPFTATSLPALAGYKNFPGSCPPPGTLTAQVKGAQVTATVGATVAPETTPVPTTAPEPTTASAPISAPTTAATTAATAAPTVQATPIEGAPDAAPPPPPPPPPLHPKISIGHAVENGVVGGLDYPAALAILAGLTPGLLLTLRGLLRKWGRR